MTAIDRLFEVASPRLHVVSRPSEDRIAYVWPLTKLPDGAIFRRVRCDKMQTVPRLFDEMAAAFQFPPYFGENWNALDECMQDLDWMRGSSYTTLLWNAETLLADSPADELARFLRLLDRVGDAWSHPVSVGAAWDRPAIPFHCIFAVPPEQVDKLVLRIRGFSLAAGPL